MSGRSALFFAAENGHDTATAILLAYGADPRQEDAVLKLNKSLSWPHPYTLICLCRREILHFLLLRKRVIRKYARNWNQRNSRQ